RVTIIPVVAEQQAMSNAVRKGTPRDYLPALTPNDVVYCAGAPAMVEVITRAAVEAGAKCYSDPFEPAAAQREKTSLLSRAADWLGSSELKSGEMQMSPPLAMADWTPPDADAPWVPQRRDQRSASAGAHPDHVV